MTTADTITTAQITALRHEAYAAQDVAQVDLCNAALSGDVAAIAECARVIANAAAMDDGE